MKNNNKTFELFGYTVDDLLNQSNKKIAINCDYCGTLLIKKKQNWFNSHANNAKDACSKCAPTKTRESKDMNPEIEKEVQRKAKEGVRKKFDVDNIMELKEYRDKISIAHHTKTEEEKLAIKEKRKTSCLENLNHPNSLYGPEQRAKTKATIKKRYNCDNIGQSKEIRAKVNKTMHERGNGPISRQQKYISLLFGAEINYPMRNFLVDIYFPIERIVCEYDGGGHDLQVKFKRTSLEEFLEAEKSREEYLEQRKCKIMRIATKKDLIPSDSILLDMLELAREVFAEGRSWIKFDLDNGTVRWKNKQINYDFGTLRKITESILQYKENNLEFPQ